MSKFSNAALRLTAGALILDAGVKKLKADEGTYAFLQQMAATGVPAVSKLDAATFGTVSYTPLRAHETGRKLVCRLLLEKNKTSNKPKVPGN